MTAEVLRTGIFNIQVCIPVDWTDAQVLEFAESEYPCGTENGWLIRREGDKALCGAPERNPCVERASHVHIMLDA